MKKAPSILFIFLSVLSMPARSSAQTVNQWGVGLSGGVSHSGFNLALTGQYRHNHFQFYFGPGITLGRGSWGLNAGADYLIESTQGWLSSVVNLDYQAGFFSSSGNTDAVHEFFLSYGLRVKAGARIYIIQQLGYGFFLESFYLENERKRENVTGYNGLVKLRAGYFF